MLNWKNDNCLLLSSPPIKVVFAGWESTTHKLQESGWQLSIRQSVDYYNPHSIVCELAMKHEQARLYALSRPLSINYGVVMDRMRLERPDPGYIAEMYNNCVFQVFCVSSEIIQQHVVESPFSTPNTKINMFHPIDARPQWDGVDMKSFRMEDMAIFRPISPDSEIVVHPDMIPKLMKDIRKAQAPKQKEIREKKRKEAMRNNTQKIDGYDAAKDIKATLVVAKG